MENASQKKSRKWRERIAFALGNLGHSAFYGALSTYFIVFVTSGMFDGVEKSIANKLIGLITGLVVIIRLAEVLVDPVIGNVVDNTQTKWGKIQAMASHRQRRQFDSLGRDLHRHLWIGQNKLDPVCDLVRHHLHHA